MVVVGPLAMGAAALVAILAALVGVATACLAWALVGVDGRLAYVADTS